MILAWRRIKKYPALADVSGRFIHLLRKAASGTEKVHLLHPMHQSVFEWRTSAPKAARKSARSPTTNAPAKKVTEAEIREAQQAKK